MQLRGAVTVDAGAATKLRDAGKSLLPIGMTQVEGEFSRGDVIAIRDVAGLELARGLANYSSGEARLLCRRPSGDIQGLLATAASPKWCTATTWCSRGPLSSTATGCRS